jgi:hypothetical protein
MKPAMATDGSKEGGTGLCSRRIVEIRELEERLEPFIQERPHGKGVFGPRIDAASHTPPRCAN